MGKRGGCLWGRNLSFDLLSKWLLNRELISSNQRQNDNGDSRNSVYIVFRHLLTLQPHNIICGMHCADAVFTIM